MADQVLILMAGLPRSGKSTRAMQLMVDNVGAAIVCPDEIRLALHGQQFVGSAEPFVWAIAYNMADALFRAGHSMVIVDATNNTAERRLEWERRFSDKLVYVSVVDTPVGECLRRAVEGGRSNLVPIIEKMNKEADWKGLDDGDVYLAELAGRENPDHIRAVVARQRQEAQNG